MFSETIKPKIDKMFDDLSVKAAEIIKNSFSRKDAAEKIAQIVGSETALRGKTMLSSMYDSLSEKFLTSIDETANRNKFYEANLRAELMDKYSFDIPRVKIDFKEANRIVISLAASAGTATAGGLLIFALSPSAPIVPITIVVAACVCAFCISCFKIIPNLNKSGFKKEVDRYLDKIKADYIKWLNEVEKYFNKRANEIKRSF